MNEELRQMMIERLKRGEELPREWAQDIFPPEKMEYELVYHGKEREGDIIANTMAVPLQEVRTFGKNGKDDWHNMLILGDNLQVLKRLLEYKKEGRLLNSDGTSGVRLIYIDPPFATEQEFKGSQEEIAYQDRLAGARFVQFVRTRLVFLKELLASDGSLFIHLDHRKIHYIKVILDELFTERNFRNDIILPGRASKNLQQQFEKISRLNVRHDTLLWYSASTKTRFAPLWIEKHKAGNPEGHWHHFWSTADRPTMRYKLFGQTPTSGQWTWEEKRAKQAIQNYKRYEVENGGRTLAEYWRDTGNSLDFIRKDEDGKPSYWRPPSEIRLADTVWAGIPIYSNSTGYPTEKNESLLQQVIELASKEGDIVLDSFAGSGTTIAVAEKLGRRWIGIDRGKLSIYTIQKRLLTLQKVVGKKGKTLTPKPFRLYNAGLYDFTTLSQMPRDDWRFFALQLFECKDEPHKIGGIGLDGKRRGSSVLVFDHHKNPGTKIDEETILSIHNNIGKKIGTKFYIIAPRHTFAFQQDYITIDDVKYYALRIPYSFINELHRREFSALQQPKDETAVNDLVDAEGFDFIQPPTVKFNAGVKKRKGQLIPEAFIKLEDFQSKARVRGGLESRGMDAFSMLLLDLDYNGEVFQLHTHLYATDMDADDWHAWFPAEAVGKKVMVVFMDIYGNESNHVITREALKLPKKKKG